MPAATTEQLVDRSPQQLALKVMQCEVERRARGELSLRQPIHDLLEREWIVAERIAVFLDVGDHDPLLPSGEPAADRRYAAGRPGIEPHQLMRQHDTESVEIQPICRKRAFDQGHEFERRPPERRILEEQSRSEGDFRKAGHLITGTPQYPTPKHGR